MNKKYSALIASIAVIVTVSGFAVNEMNTSEIMTDSTEPIPGPPPILMSKLSVNKFSIEEAKIGTDLSWAKESNYAPKGFEIKSIHSTKELMYVNYGLPTSEVSDDLMDNIKNGIVVVYFEDGSPFEDWDAHAKKQAESDRHRSISQHDDKTFLLLDNPEGKNEAFYRDGLKTWTVMSNDVLVDELGKILVSIVS